MFKHLFYFCSFISLLGCSSIKIENGYMVKEDTYRVPIINNESWSHFIPASGFDGVYLRCPNEQLITIFNTILCQKYDYLKMLPEDYAKRIYENTYFSFGERLTCPEPYSPLTDKHFKKLDTPPDVNNDKKQFTIVYETTFDGRICGSNTVTFPMKVMDVFIEEQKFHLWGALHTRFVVFRYASPIDQYENGITDFKEMVSKFEWIKGAP